MPKHDENELVHYKGSQLSRSQLPANYDEADVMPIDQWFEQNKNRDEPRHKAILTPVATGGVGDEPTAQQQRQAEVAQSKRTRVAVPAEG